MALLDFPNSPTSGTTYNAPNGATYSYDGAAWTCSSGGAGGGALGTQSIYTANATLTTANHDSLINANAASVQLTLPAFSTALAGQVYRITRVDAQAAQQATIMPAGADTIDGVNAFITIAPNESVSLMACGTVANARNWVRTADPTWRTIQSSNTLTPGDGNKVLVSQAAGNAMQWGARTSKARLAAGLVADAADSVTLSLNGGAYPFSSNPDNTANASWQTRMRGGTSDDWSVLRAPATSGIPAFAALVTLDNVGRLTVPGDATNGPAIVFGTPTSKGRLIHHPTSATSYLTENVSLTIASPFWVQDDVTKPSWTFGMSGTSDLCTLNRIPAGSTTPTALLQIDNAGNLAATGIMTGAAYGALMTRTAALSIPNSTNSTIPFDTTVWQKGSIVSGSNLLTPVTGVYLVVAAATWAANATGARMLWLYNKAGTALTRSELPAGATGGSLQQILVWLYTATDPTDYLYIQGWQNSGAALSLGGLTLAQFGVWRLG